MVFNAVWFAGGELRTGVFGARSEQVLRSRLAYWWGRDCADFEVIEISEAVASS
jgi:hypothetical protein